jgi:hypothetical protein
MTVISRGECSEVGGVFMVQLGVLPLLSPPREEVYGPGRCSTTLRGITKGKTAMTVKQSVACNIVVTSHQSRYGTCQE